MAGAAAAWLLLGVRPDRRPPGLPADARAPAAGADAGAAPSVGPPPSPAEESPPEIAGPAPGASARPGDSSGAFLDPQAFAPPPGLGLREFANLSDFDRLRARRLLFPVEGFDPRRLRDDFADQRGARVHEAIDLPAPRGTPVRAVDDGVIAKLFNSAAGGWTVYQFDPEHRYAYYYAHLDRYADGLAEGAVVRRGDRIGYVGTSGNSPPQAPHLHFTIFRLGPERRWWEGTPVNPYPLFALSR